MRWKTCFTAVQQPRSSCGRKIANMLQVLEAHLQDGASGLKVSLSQPVQLRLKLPGDNQQVMLHHIELVEQQGMGV